MQYSVLYQLPVRMKHSEVSRRFAPSVPSASLSVQCRSPTGSPMPQSYLTSARLERAGAPSGNIFSTRVVRTEPEIAALPTHSAQRVGFAGWKHVPYSRLDRSWLRMSDGAMRQVARGRRGTSIDGTGAAEEAPRARMIPITSIAPTFA